jgi:hypothetical protein
VASTGSWIRSPGWLADRRVHPNLLTTLGFLVTIGAAWAFHRHAMHTAGFLVLLGGFFDILDGRVARLTGLGSKFGAFYDSTLDRVSEIAVYFGILSLYNSYRQELGDVGMIYLVMAGHGRVAHGQLYSGPRGGPGPGLPGRAHAPRRAGGAHRRRRALLRRRLERPRPQGRDPGAGADDQHHCHSSGSSGSISTPGACRWTNHNHKRLKRRPLTTPVDIRPADGKLGILLPGLGAVATTFIAGVEAVRRGWPSPSAP